ncbi:MAG: FAD-binding oxidoreductase [Pseudomonadota bacterium]
MRTRTDTYSGWGRAIWATGEIARPERQAHVSGQHPATGNRRSYGDACLNDAGIVTDMTRLDRILSFDPETGILEVEAGVPLGQIADVFAPKGWLPAVMPGTGFATVGGAIAMDVHGKNHHLHGSFGQHVIEITLKQGGQVAKITPESPAFKATLGGLGQTGVILAAKLQMMACKGDIMMVTERRIPDWDSFLESLDASQATYTVGWIDATAKGKALGRGILEEAETAAGLVPKPKPSKKVPFNAPKWALSAPIVRMFNRLYYKRVPKAGRTVVKPIDAFFFPLDKIHDWNKLYGKPGFHQFQCVVPLEAADALKAMLEKIAQSGLASPLAVLKRMGAGRGGYMSFPMEGYTLAVDFPNRPGVENLLAVLEAETAKAGGRIYFAKDSVSSADHINAMYPELQAWRKEVDAIDPDHSFETNLTRRLGLRGDA